MRVLQIVTTDDRTFFLDQVEALERKGVDCDVLPTSPGQRTYKGTLGPVSRRLLPDPGHNLPYYVINALYAYPRVLKSVLAGEYDVVHTNSGLTAPFGLLQPKRPVVQTFWGSDLMGNYLRGYYKHVSRHSARYFDAVIVRNEEMRNALGGDAHVIPAGIDLEKFRPVPQEEARRTVGWDDDKRHVLFPYPPEAPDEEGFSHERKRARKNYPLAKTVVERANEEMADIVELRAVHDEPHDRIPYFMSAADALLLTSSLEGSPNTVKEALACNLPVVSTDVGDVRERLRDVHPSAIGTTEDDLVEGLVDVLEHGGRCNGREQVEPLSWDRMADRIIDVYEGVLSGQRATVPSRRA